MSNRKIGDNYTGTASADMATVRELIAELSSADRQLEMAAQCIESGRLDEALLHCRSMARPRRAVLTKATGGAEQ